MLKWSKTPAYKQISSYVLCLPYLEEQTYCTYLHKQIKRMYTDRTHNTSEAWETMKVSSCILPPYFQNNVTSARWYLGFARFSSYEQSWSWWRVLSCYWTSDLSQCRGNQRHVPAHGAALDSCAHIKLVFWQTQHEFWRFPNCAAASILLG